MKVVISTRARRDLLGVGEWIERDHPARATSYVEELYALCRSLGEFPNGCPPAPEFGAGIRKRTHGNYLILYRVARHVTIVSIRHAARRRDPLA